MLEVVERAAKELAMGLEALASTLAVTHRPRAAPYGPGRIAGRFQRRSPLGFQVGWDPLQVLLPDGRVWTYRDSDGGSYPRFMHSRVAPCGREFQFLGAVLGGCVFGCADRNDRGPGLCALLAAGRSALLLSPEDAFSVITRAAAVA